MALGSSNELELANVAKREKVSIATRMALPRLARRENRNISSATDEDLALKAHLHAELSRWGEEIGDYATPELVELLGSVLPDSELVEQIKRAADGRVHADILSPAGAYGVRYLAAFVLSYDEERRCPTAALRSVLQAINDRIGSQAGEWLNSLAVIGQRIAGELYDGRMSAGKFYSAARSTSSDVAADDAATDEG
jgi:hypothetical protein